jgi:hypothetical protein
MPLAAAGEVAVLAALLASRYISAHTDIPTGGNEVVGGSYARQAAGTWSNAGSDPTVASNDANITFPTATADWGAITHFGIYDAVSGGNLLAYEAVSVSKTILIGDILRFLAGEIDVSVT